MLWVQQVIAAFIIDLHVGDMGSENGAWRLVMHSSNASTIVARGRLFIFSLPWSSFGRGRTESLV